MMANTFIGSLVSCSRPGHSLPHRFSEVNTESTEMRISDWVSDEMTKQTCIRTGGGGGGEG